MARAERKSTEARSPRIRQVPAVSRALAILRLLGDSTEPLGLKNIATSLSLVPSTCLHILRVLVAEELIKVDPETRRYSLGSGMLGLARSVIERSGFASLAQPALDRLAKKWNVTGAGAEIERGKDMILLAISRSRLPFALHMDVGLRFPYLASASGRLVAAFCGERLSDLKRHFSVLQWGKPMDFDTWVKEAEQAKKRGFFVDRGRFYSGVTVVAVPVFNSAGAMTHTLAAMALSDQFDTSRIAGLARDMRDEASHLSRLLLPKG
jgi:DNA-binding IclR family transcriptional regulator